MKVHINNYRRFYFVKDNTYLELGCKERSNLYKYKVTDISTNNEIKNFETFEMALLYLLKNQYAIVNKEDIFEFDHYIQLRPSEGNFITDILNVVEKDEKYKHYFRNLSKVIINKIKA